MPSRLTPAMNQALETSDVPFGRVIRPLEPFRRTFAAETLWQPLPAGWETLNDATLADAAAQAAPLHYDAARPLFEHRALVLRKDSLPIAEVRETYKMALLKTALD